MALEAPSPALADDTSSGPDLAEPSHEAPRPSHRLRANRLEPGLFGGRIALAVVGLGLLVIGFGWYGISGRGAQINGTTDVRAQLPYLVSGGFLGLAIVVLGAALLVAHTSRLERARSEVLLEARLDALTAALGGTVVRQAPDGQVVAGTAAYHSPDCRLVDGRAGQDYVAVEVAEANGLRPCRLCLG